MLVKKKGWKAGTEPASWEQLICWGMDCWRVTVPLETWDWLVLPLGEGSVGHTGPFCPLE